MSKHPRILVVGGAGVTGKSIVQDLSEHLPHVKIDVGGRSIKNSTPVPDKVGRLKIDINDETSAIAKIKNYDLVIFAIGPFEAFGNKPHKICCQAGVDCIDINDELNAALEIFKLDSAAKEKGVKILTGMGMCPGLTTLLLMSVLKKARSGKKRLRSRLFLGSNPEVGFAAAQTALAGFRPEVSEIRNGEFCYINADDDDLKESNFLFPNYEQPLPTLHCPAIEAFTLKNSPEIEIREIDKFDLRIYIQGMKKETAQSIRKSEWLRKPQTVKLFSRLAVFMNNFLKNSPNKVSTAVVECISHDEKISAYITGQTSYEMTARFASIVAQLLLENKIFPRAGVQSFENNRIDDSIFIEALKTRNLEIVFE
jgi:hypothetical protein